MSWLSNTFKSLQFNQQTTQNDGVKDDLTAIGESIGRQFRAFLSPESSNSGENSGGVGGSHHTSSFDGIRSDFEEIKGTFKSSISIFSSSSNSNYNAVNEISKLAVNFLNFNDGDDEIDVGYVNSMISKVNDGGNDGNNDGNDGGDDDDDDDDGDDDDMGVDDEVIEFAQQISKRAELWTEFPLSFDYEFDLSEAQYEHVSIIEQLVPSLADLRSKISSDKSEKQFWMIYFILLLPRLNEDDAELLSTPETVEARETLLKMILSKKNEGTDSEDPQLDSSSDADNKVEASIISSQSVENVTTSETTKALGSAKSNEANQSDAKPENDTREEEKHAISESSAASASKRFQSEDDVSFSDLEDDDNDLSNRQLSSGPTQSTRTSSPEGSSDWVRLNKNVEDRGKQVKGQSSTNSEGEDSTGWLTVDDFDP